jgi:hypothetical protein
MRSGQDWVLGLEENEDREMESLFDSWIAGSLGKSDEWSFNECSGTIAPFLKRSCKQDF